VTPSTQGSIRLFGFAGINVYLHWSWFILAFYAVQYRAMEYVSTTWALFEYVSLFIIVLIHEFGHQLACRQVGGKTDDIVLWPLGGVAYVKPPERPGAQLWAIAAGPLVNVVLVPILYVLAFVGAKAGWYEGYRVPRLLTNVFYLNLGLLAFNLMPVFPLDGGQILRSLLWFVIGRSKSLLVATVIGFFGVIGFLVLAFLMGHWMLAIAALFLIYNCWQGFNYSRSLAKIERAPKRSDMACPACKASPPLGAFWHCAKCRQPFDLIQAGGVCAKCGTHYDAILCLDCGERLPASQWLKSVPPPLPKT
jgi:Zn-dependent protease